MGRGTRRGIAAALITAVVLAGCSPTDTPPPLPTPLKASGAPSVVVFGDSLTPVLDYRAQANELGFRFYHQAQGGSHICTEVGGQPAWQRILTAIETFDVVVLQYQGWQNYSIECGGPAAGLPTGHQSDDPGQRWRAYLAAFAEAARAAGTRIYLAESPGAPPDIQSFAVAMRIMDDAARAAAAEFPRILNFVPSRRYFTDARGNWTSRSGCLAQEAQWCSGGTVALRAKDRIHYACPGTSGLVCAGRSPAGTRHALLMFAAITARPQRPPVPPSKPPPAETTTTALETAAAASS